MNVVLVDIIMLLLTHERIGIERGRQELDELYDLVCVV